MCYCTLHQVVNECIAGLILHPEFLALVLCI